MYKFMRKNRGAISIFLVIVLLPMLSVASVFVDMSRIQLAKSVAESAGDLTLNSALTEYDAVLKDMYGLFAVSQDIDELMENLEDYYTRSIEAAGVPADQAESYVDEIMSFLDSATGTDDLLNISVTDFEMTKPTGGSLANPAILKSQIVEFMKYRAPLDLGAGFLDALNSMKDMDKQTDLVDKKNEFYKEQQTVMGYLEDAWRCIQAHQYSCQSMGYPTGNYVTDNAAKLDQHATNLGGYVSDAIAYLYYADDFDPTQCEISHEKGDDGKSDINDLTTLADDAWEIKYFGQKIDMKPAYDTDNPATADDVLECLKDTLAAIKAYKKYTTLNTSDSNGKAYRLAYNTSNNADEVAKIYAVAIFNQKGKSSYAQSVRNLLQNLVNLQSALITCPLEEVQQVRVSYIASEYTVDLAQYGTTTLYSVAKSQLTHLNLDDGGWLKLFNTLTGRLNGFYNNLIGTLNSKKTTIKSGVETLRSDTVRYYNVIYGSGIFLAGAYDYLFRVSEQLVDPNSAYNKALTAWKNQANELSDNTMGKNDLDEIEKLNEILTIDRVNALLGRLTKAISTIDSVSTEITKYKFCNTSWKDFSESKNGYQIVKESLTSEIKQEIEAIEPKSVSSYSEIITKVKASIQKGSIVNTWNDTEYSPDLTVPEEEELYTWMRNNFYTKNMNYEDLDANEDQTKSGDEDLENSKEDLKKQADQYTESEPNSSTEVNVDLSAYLQYLPSNTWDGLEKQIEQGEINTNQDELLKSSSGTVKNLLSTVMDLLGNMATSLRDDLYVTDYIMNMFTYDTIEAEAYVKVEKSASDFSAFYEKVDDEYKLKSGKEKYAAQMLSLTNNSLNPNMNYLYGSEVEYILYGSPSDKDGDDSTDKVYGTIFVLRFAFNTVYAFTDAEINNTTLAAATAIFGTPPLTPLIPVAKTAMIIGLAIAESSYDLFTLKRGEAVPLMKNGDTWIMKPSGAMKAVVNEVGTTVLKYAANRVVEEGYKVLNDALEKTNEELQALIDAGQDGIAELASAAAGSMIDKFENYANEALQYVVTLCNEANQKAMLDPNYNKETDAGATDSKVAQVITGLREWLNEQGAATDGAIYEVKELAVNYLIENGGSTIKEIFDAIEQTASGEDASIISTKLEDIKTVINLKIRDLVNIPGSKVKETLNSLEDKLKNAAKEGAESLRQTLNTQIDQIFGQTSTGASATSSVVSSLLSWSYSDYLMLFVTVGMVTNEEPMLLRMADVIELNMQHMNGEYAAIATTETVSVSRFFGLWKTKEEITTTTENQKAFKLSNAYTYITISAKLEVKPLLMTMPFMAETVENELTGTQWYQISYEGTLGY